MFIFLVHFSVFLIKDQLYNPTPKRLKTIFRRSVFIEILVYLTIGIFGYYSMGNKTPHVIILRESIPGLNKWPMIIARIAFTINLSISTATIGNPLRN